MRECPVCGEPDPIWYPPEDDDEHGIWSCPECGWEVGDDMGSARENRRTS